MLQHMFMQLLEKIMENRCLCGKCVTTKAELGQEN